MFPYPALLEHKTKTNNIGCCSLYTAYIHCFTGKSVFTNVRVTSTSPTYQVDFLKFTHVFPKLLL